MIQSFLIYVSFTVRADALDLQATVGPRRDPVEITRLSTGSGQGHVTAKVSYRGLDLTNAASWAMAVVRTSLEQRGALKREAHVSRVSVEVIAPMDGQERVVPGPRTSDAFLRALGQTPLRDRADLTAQAPPSGYDVIRDRGHFGSCGPGCTHG